MNQIPAGYSRRSLVTVVPIQPRLDQFQIPIAQLAPEKVIDAVGRLVESIGCERSIHIGRDAVEARQDPAILQRLGCKSGNAQVRTAALGGPAAGLTRRDR